MTHSPDASVFADFADQADEALAAFFRKSLDYLKADFETGDLERDRVRRIEDELVDLFPSDDSSGPMFFAAVRSLLEYFVHVGTPRDVSRAESLTETVCRAVLRRFVSDDAAIAGWKICYEAIAAIKQSYWNAVDHKAKEKCKYNRTHRVIRINDIPFAEAIFPALLAQNSNALGYTILIEDVDWSEVGAALLNDRIDVAIYPSYAAQHIKLVDTIFERKNIYRSAPLMTYRDYPIIRNPKASVSGKGKLGVPIRSEFIPLLDEAAKDGFLEVKLGNAKIARVSLSADVKRCKSADAVAAKVVNGELEFGIVGGLQAEYVSTQYAKEVHHGRNDHIEICHNINPVSDSGEVFFWTAANRRDEAETLLGAMVSIWNESVVQGWQEISNSEAEAADEFDRKQKWLVGMVNAQSHCAFVSDFAQLKTLIQRHDHNLGDTVPRGVELVQV